LSERPDIVSAHCRSSLRECWQGGKFLEAERHAIASARPHNDPERDFCAKVRSGRMGVSHGGKRSAGLFCVRADVARLGADGIGGHRPGICRGSVWVVLAGVAPEPTGDVAPGLDAHWRRTGGVGFGVGRHGGLATCAVLSAAWTRRVSALVCNVVVDLLRRHPGERWVGVGGLLAFSCGGLRLKSNSSEGGEAAMLVEHFDRLETDGP